MKIIRKYRGVRWNSRSSSDGVWEKYVVSVFLDGDEFYYSAYNFSEAKAKAFSAIDAYKDSVS